MFTRILFATDFSDDAARAQEYAMYLATACDAALDVLHVVEAPHG
jgi:nucleotide-binding universal stress UspA family protein